MGKNADILRDHAFSNNGAHKDSKKPLLNPDAAKSFGLQSGENEEENPIDWLEVARRCIVPQGVEIPQPVTLFALNDIPVLTVGELSLLIAKPKQGKSTVAAWIAGRLLKQGYKVLVIDTEQGLFYSSRMQWWILKGAGMSTCDNLTYLDLKKYNANERLDVIEAYLGAHGYEYDLVVIDGVRDLLNDINDNTQTSIVVSQLMKWAVECSLHILNILHKNKTDNSARGALGTELMNKAETTMDVALEGDQIVVSALYTRNETFAPFAFVRDSYGTPQMVDGYVMPISEGKKKPSIKWGDIPDGQHERILMDVFGNGWKPKLSELRTRLANCYDQAFNVELGERKVKSLLDYLMNDLQLVGKEGADRSPNAYYYLTSGDITGTLKNDATS